MKPKTKFLSTVEDEDKPLQQLKNLPTKRSFFMAETGLFPFYPYYFQNTLTKKQQQFYTSNGHSLLIRNLAIQVVSQLTECKRLWKEFSPKSTLFDTWDFRFAFWKGYKYTPHFLVFKNELENYALLPLWYEDDKKKYFWFGSWWQEENKFLVKDQLFIPLLLAICPSPVELNAISTELPSWIKQVIRLKSDEPKYILNLDKINCLDDYLATFRKKKRYNLRRDKRIIESQNPKVTFNRFEDLDTLIRLSKERFEQKGEETDWEDERRVETFRNVIKLGRKNEGYQVRMLTVTIGTRIASVDLVAIYNGCYYPLKCGYDVKNFPGIGNYVNLLEIEDALHLRVNKMDFLEIGYGWKDKWFDAVPLLKYEK